MKKFWTEEEDNYLINNIEKLTWSEMADFLNCSILTVQNRAEYLGYEVIHHQKDRWTKEEVELLREYSKKYLGKTIAKKLNKSYTSIKKKAQKENIIIKYKSDIWKPWMIHYLKDNVNKKSIRQIALFLELSEYQVRKKCDELNITYDNNRWTKEEENILIENASKCHYSELTKLIPGKSKSAILCKARSMNIEIITELEGYEDEKAKYIIDNWGKISINQICRDLGIARSRLYLYKAKYNLPNVGQRKKWDEKNLNKLEKLSKEHSIDELANKFHTTRSAIITTASKNGIKLIDGKKRMQKETLDKIRELAPNHTLNEISEILNIPTNGLGVYARRHNIIIKKDDSRYWKNDEIELLKKLCNEKVPIYKIMSFIDKTDQAIIKKCRELNLDFIGFSYKSWTDEELDSIISDAKELDINKLVMKYNRSSVSIRSKLKKHNIQTIKYVEPWTDEDIKRLRELVEQNKSINEIAKELNRTHMAIEVKINKERIDFGNQKHWSKEDEQYLEDNWDEHTITYLSKKLKRSYSSIKNKAYNLGLRKQLLHPEGITIAEIAELFNVNRNDVEITWIILGLPIKTQKISNSTSYRYVEIDDLFNFLEHNQFLYDGKDFEENILGVEPDWVKQKRKHDYFEGFNDNHISLTKKKLLQQKKYFLEELKKQEEVLKRTKKL